MIRAMAVVLLGCAAAAILCSTDIETLLIDRCEARYFSCDRLRAVAASIESSMVYFGRWDGDTREQRERDIERLRRTKDRNI